MVKKRSPSKRNAVTHESARRYIPSTEMHPRRVYKMHAERHTDGFAIASLVCGLAGFLLPLVNLAAVAFGIVALHRIRKDPIRHGRGLAVVGIVLGVLSVLIILTALGVGIARGALSIGEILMTRQ